MTLVAASVTLDAVLGLFAKPFDDLVQHAHLLHRGHHDPAEARQATPLGIRAGSCGGVGLDGDRAGRAGTLLALAHLEPGAEGVPVDLLLPPPAAPAPVDPQEMVRTVAVARILMPRAQVRLAADSDSLSDEAQALCFRAGANAIVVGDCPDLPFFEEPFHG